MTKEMWCAVARSADVRRKPLRVMFRGKPVVLFRHDTGIGALYDQCPHRLIELSKGRVVSGTIECPYHGWRFAPDGNCIEMPGCVEALPRCRVPRYAVIEREGGIFLAENPPAEPPRVHPMEGQDIVTRIIRSSARSTLVDAAENVLDSTHTHFTHKGLLRGLSKQRYRVQVEVTTGPDWVEAVYTGEERQHGLVSALLDGLRTKGIGRYRRGGVAELEFWGPKGMVLATTFHLRQSDPETVSGLAWLTAPRQAGIGYVKAVVLRPMFQVALMQDRRALGACYDNAMGARPMVGPLDFLRKDIEALEAGEILPEETRQYEIEL